MAQQDLLKQGQTVDASLDNVIIQKNLETVPGGRTLDVTGFADTYIQAGHVIFRHNDTGEYVPQPVDGSIPLDGDAVTEAEAVGVLSVSIPTDKPQAAIMVRGTVNENPLAYPINAATKAKLPSGIQYALND